MAKFSKLSWTSIVSYEEAVSLLSTDSLLNGTNAKPFLDALTATQCETRASGAWMANDRDSYVAYKSAAVAKAGRVSSKITA